MSARRKFELLGLISVLALFTLVICAPPDGRERAELAQFLGNFHPLLVHLPIGLLLLVPVLEIAGRSERRAFLRPAVGFVLGLSAIAAVVAPFFGWLLAWSAGFEGDFVTQHMWGGACVAALSLICWFLRGHRSATSLPIAKSGALYFVALAAVLPLVAWTGYRGGQLAHGEDHLTEHMPQGLRSLLGSQADRRVEGGTPSTFFSARIQPILEEHCLLCHSANKRKGGLRLDSYEMLLKGGKDGLVVKAGDAKGSDLYRRITLAPTHRDFMPAEGKPPLLADDVKLIGLWIDAGASQTAGVDAIAGAPKIDRPAEPLAPDYRPDGPIIARLESSLNVRLLPRSQNPTDGLVLRTASSPEACDDAALASLAPVARYIVDAELSRTSVTDAGLKSLSGFTNLRWLDLSHTQVTSPGVSALIGLKKLEVLNLTATFVDDAGVDLLRKNGVLKRVYHFQSRAVAESQMGPGGTHAAR